MEQVNISFNELAERLNRFDEERNWIGLDPSDLAKSIVLEAAELLEHYQWDNTIVKRNKGITEKNKQEIALEVADIFIYLLKFCREAKIDLMEATLKKLQKVAEKYPSNYSEKGGRQEYQRIKKRHRRK